MMQVLVPMTNLLGVIRQGQAQMCEVALSGPAVQVEEVMSERQGLLSGVLPLQCCQDCHLRQLLACAPEKSGMNIAMTALKCCPLPKDVLD